MSPKQLKSVPLTQNLLKVIDNDTKPYDKVISAIEAYRNPAIVYRQTPIDAARTAIKDYNVPRPYRWSHLSDDLDLAQKRFPGYFNNLYDLASLAPKPLGDTDLKRIMANQDIQGLGFYRKDLSAQKNDLKNLESQRLIGKPITYDEFIADNPIGSTLFKGGHFEPVSWKISEPGWASGRDSVAESYALSPTRYSGNTNIPMIHTVPIKNSKSLRTGKNFFTGHVSKRGKNARRIADHDQKYWHAVATSSDRYPNYETVINGNEMRNMPWRTYEQIIPEDLEHIPVQKILREQITPGDLGFKFQQVNRSIIPEISLKNREIRTTSRAINDLRETIKKLFRHPITDYNMRHDPLLKTKPELPFWERRGLKDLLLYFGGSHGAKYGEI